MRTWKDIPGYEGKYQVSTDGFVRSMPDIDHRGQIMTGRILKQSQTHNGYSRIVLTDSKTFRVHRLVADAFIPNPDNLPQVNHIDGDKGNNTVGNLEWCNNSHNQKHRYDVLGHAPGMLGKTGIKCPNSKPVAARSVKTGEHVGFFGSAAEAGRVLGIHDSGVTMCARGKLQSYKGMQFVFVTRQQYAEAASE